MTAAATLLQPVEPDENATPQADDLRLWSVTTIIGVLDKPALMYWAAEEAATCALDNQNTWRAMLQDDGRDAAIKYIRDARLRRPRNRLSDTEFGTRLHKLFETYALTGQRPPITRDHFLDDHEAAVKCMDQFDRWLQDFQPIYKAAEFTVYTPEYGIAGTSDGILEIGGIDLIGDYKSSKKSWDARGNPTRLYDEISLQLAAYRHARMAAIWRVRRYEQQYRRYYLLNPTEQEQAIPVPPVDGGIGIKITPEHCTAYPIDCGPDIYEYFLHTLELARYKYLRAKTIIGPPLTPPTRQGAA